MAKLVLAVGVPHPPRLVREIADAGPGQLRAEALMRQVRQYVEKAAPDVIIEIDSDHFVNFFYENVPPFVWDWRRRPKDHRKSGVPCPSTRFVVTFLWPVLF